MAIVLNSIDYGRIKIDSKMIIGLMGDNYHHFLKSLRGNDIIYVDKIDNNYHTVSDFINSLNVSLNSDLIGVYLDNLGLDKTFVNRHIDELSHSERRLLAYLKALIVNVKIIVVDEPFQDLDYQYKKKIITLFHHLVKNKTIIVGSQDSDIIYSLCKKVLLINNKNKYYYGDVIALSNKNYLKRYHVNMPQIVEFIRLAKEKKVNIPYSYDVRDLIKDVYRHVTK